MSDPPNSVTGSSTCSSADSPLSAAYYADSALVCQVELVENVRLARDTYRVRIHCREIARRIVPGQFVMLRLADQQNPLLGRPLALYDTVLNDDGEPIGVDLVYLVVGKMTGKLATAEPGQPLEIWGPLGNGFPTRACDHLIMVAGGIGQTPFVAVAREATGRRQYGQTSRDMPQVPQVTLCYGVRTADLAAGVADFEDAGARVTISSDDGTIGHHGFVTDLLEQQLAERTGATRVVCCGPEPMMERVADICERAQVPCEVSLETPMACGIGVCFSCVARVRQPDGSWDYKRTCVDGPVFDAEKLVW